MATDAGDNRIRLDQTPVDDSVRDKTGGLLDTYPEANTQARADFMRSYLIGLLSNQASIEGCEPIEKIIGTTWFNKTIMALLLYDGEAFDTIAQYLSATDENGESTTVQAVLTTLVNQSQFVGPRVIWSGVFTEDEINQIPVPKEFEGYAQLPNMTPLVYLNGLLIDPRSTEVVSEGTFIAISGVDPKPRDEFTVILENVTAIKNETVPAGG